MSKRYVTFLHRIEYALWVVAGTILPLFPRRALVAIADFLGWFAYKVLRLRRAVVEDNIEHAFRDTLSPDRRREIVLKSYQNAILTFFEFLTPSSAEKHVLPAINQEHFEKVKDTVALIITAHVGNWEMIPPWVRDHGVRLAAVAKPMHNSLIDGAIMHSREEHGLTVITTAGSLKGIVRAARDGMWVGFLGDQDARRHGIFVDFFGRPASTAEGVALFSWKLNVPMIPMFFVRQPTPERHLQMVFCPLIYPNPDAPRDEEILRLTQEHTKALEAIVRQYPENYFWMHQRWKTKPKRARE